MKKQIASLIFTTFFISFFTWGCSTTLEKKWPLNLIVPKSPIRDTQHLSRPALENQTGTVASSSGNSLPTSDVSAELALENSETKASPETAGTQTSGPQTPLDQALDFCEASQNFWSQGKFDNAIQALDQAYSLLLESDAGEDEGLTQQKEDIRFLISKRILEIYASRHTIVNGTHKAIPVTINKDVQKEINYYTTGNGRKFFIESYQRSGKYRPFIVRELEKAGLPEELSWLPLIESGFKPRALSKARALGLWQFIPSTGYKFGLERDMYVDERLDPKKATAAAIAYLKALHQIFGDWSTVLASYNCGEGRVLRVIRSNKINYLDNFWDLYQQLPRETARYVPKFLATLHVVNNLDKYGMDSAQPVAPTQYETVEVSKRVHLKKIAQAINVPYSDLVELNPELRHKILPPGSYQLHLPEGKKETLLAQIKNIPATLPPQKKFIYHRVRRGEALSTIARKYRTRVSTIARANNIYRYNHIKAGKLLKIPLSPSKAKAATAVTYRKTASGPASHTVCRGESLWLIAQKYGTTITAIEQANNLQSSMIDVGQTLKIPGEKKGNHKTYQVKKGDSPFIIASRHKMALEQFLKLNNFNPSSKIYPGQTVYVK